ncbi:MAG: DUF6359 domain-containing protein [Prevotella sp.]|nr:hypothetical protein [Prevotella sp.]MDD6738392.1 DUF6359 domain-containing protein [Prevotella sp.]MDY6093102.1 DUF6359 domain-containing protein [Prevotella sp.]
MRTLTSLLLLFMLLIPSVTGCEQPVTEEEADNKTTDAGHPSGGANDGWPATYYTVSQAQKYITDERICIYAYIVGSTSATMTNAVTQPPFEGSTAILLADDILDVYPKNKLLPVCLTHDKTMRAKLNLEDNPKLWKRRIAIVGLCTTYLNVVGLKDGSLYHLMSDNELGEWSAMPSLYEEDGGR